MPEEAIVFIVLSIFWILITAATVAWWWRRGPKLANSHLAAAMRKREPHANHPKRDWRRQVVNVANAFAAFHVFLVVVASQRNQTAIAFVVLTLPLLAFNYYFIFSLTRQYGGTIDAESLVLRDRKPIVFADITDLKVKDIWGRKLIVVQLRGKQKRRIAKWRIADIRIHDRLSTAVVEIYNPGRVAAAIPQSQLEKMTATLMALEDAFDTYLLRDAA
ncbi:MAG: hypothetical protein Q4P06_03250 [Actinomycetaceae bacterium]|nr:hypothetical protein [Actinomycetaceae bacterium]